MAAVIVREIRLDQLEASTMVAAQVTILAEVTDLVEEVTDLEAVSFITLEEMVVVIDREATTMTVHPITEVAEAIVALDVGQEDPTAAAIIATVLVAPRAKEKVERPAAAAAGSALARVRPGQKAGRGRRVAREVRAGAALLVPEVEAATVAVGAAVDLTNTFVTEEVARVVLHPRLKEKDFGQRVRPGPRERDFGQRVLPGPKAGRGRRVAREVAAAADLAISVGLDDRTRDRGQATGV